MLAPAFPFGGMEHPGVVMFNEDRFIFRERPTLPRRLGRFSTILHEVAHQWFGDLVTMRWFDDLWLKEGFATYMVAKALADLEPVERCLENVLSVQQADCVWRGSNHGHHAALAGAREPRPGQERVRRDRIQQGAECPEAAQLSGGRKGFSGRRASVSERSRVRKCHVAGLARRAGEGRTKTARQFRQELHAQAGDAGGATAPHGARGKDREPRTRAETGAIAFGDGSVADADAGALVVPGGRPRKAGRVIRD